MDVEQGSNGGQSRSGLIKQKVAGEIVSGLQPFTFELAPQHLGQIKVRRIRRQVKQEESSLLPNLSTLLHLFCGVSAGIVHHHHGDLALCMEQELCFPREAFHLIKKEVAVDVFGGGLEAARVGAREQGKTIDPKAFARGHPHVFISKLPSIRHVTLRGNPAFVSIIQGNQSFFTQAFQFGQSFEFQGVKLRARLLGGTFSDAFIATTVFFTKRTRVRWQNRLPSASSSSPLAKPRR